MPTCNKYVVCSVYVCSVCQSEMANTVAKVMTTLLSLRDERTEQQQQQYVGYVSFFVLSLC